MIVRAMQDDSKCNGNHQQQQCNTRVGLVHSRQGGSPDLVQEEGVEGGDVIP